MITTIGCLALCAVIGITVGYVSNKLDRHFRDEEEW